MKIEQFYAWALDTRTDIGLLRNTVRTRSDARIAAAIVKQQPGTPFPKMCVRKVSVTFSQLPERPVK